MAAASPSGHKRSPGRRCGIPPWVPLVQLGPLQPPAEAERCSIDQLHAVIGMLTLLSEMHSKNALSLIPRSPSQRSITARTSHSADPSCPIVRQVNGTVTPRSDLQLWKAWASIVTRSSANLAPPAACSPERPVRRSSRLTRGSEAASSSKGRPLLDLLEAFAQLHRRQLPPVQECLEPHRPRRGRDRHELQRAAPLERPLTDPLQPVAQPHLLTYTSPCPPRQTFPFRAPLDRIL
mmetsp:Transcript_57003/g.121030  ORF Transcript_57003/g.121030 Transcript_57003/m.121030 type:complete len:236 (-) Transcript_57003:563-1270(-)